MHCLDWLGGVREVPIKNGSFSTVKYVVKSLFSSIQSTKEALGVRIFLN